MLTDAINTFKPLDLKTINENPFKLIGDDWALLSAGTVESWNTMTIAWGSIGVLWNQPVFTAFVRPTRHTYSFMEKNDLFTVSWFDKEKRDALSMCGKVSGRDRDKAKAAGITPFSLEGSVSFEEARMVLVCRTLYSDDIDPARFKDIAIESNYPLKDYHRMYVGKIESAWRK